MKTALMMIKKTLRIINRYRHIYINVDLNPLAKPNASHTPRRREECVEDRQQLQLHYRREQRRGEEEVGDLFKLDWSQEKIWQRTAQDRLTWMGHAEAFSTLTDNRRQRAAILCDDTRAPSACSIHRDRQHCTSLKPTKEEAIMQYVSLLKKTNW